MPKYGQAAELEKLIKAKIFRRAFPRNKPQCKEKDALYSIQDMATLDIKPSYFKFSQVDGANKADSNQKPDDEKIF